MKAVTWKFRGLQAQQRLTNDQIAKEVGVSRNTVSNWRNSKDDEFPGLDGRTLAKVLQVLNCSLTDLLSVEEIADQEESAD